MNLRLPMNRVFCRQVLECGSPLPLSDGAGQSARGLAHSKTLARITPAPGGSWPVGRSARNSGFSARCRRAGFTLMELLLAVGIFAIVLASINTVFYAALRLRNKVTHLLDETAPLYQALGTLRRDLQGAAAPGVKLAGPMQSLAAGTTLSQSSGLQFYTTTGLLSVETPWGDIQKVVYQLKPPTNGVAFAGQGLVRTVTRNLLPTAQEEYVDEYLMGNIDQLLFSYYDGTNWTETWDSTTLGGLPRAVRVQIVLVSEDQAPLRAPEPIELLVPLVAQTRTNQTQTAQQ